MRMSPRTLLFAAVALIRFAAGQSPGPDAGWVVRAIEAKCAAARQYTFDAVIELARKTGEEPRDVVANFKVKVAVAPEGKFLLWVSDKQNLEYLIVSDGRTTWAYVPGQNSYVRLEAGDAGVSPDPDEVFSKGVQNGDRDPVLCSKLVIPILARLARNASMTDMNKVADVTIGGEERQLPVLSVLSDHEGAGRSLTDVVVDPETMDLVRVEWTRPASADDEQRFAFLRIEFEKLRIGDPIPASYFAFSPPGDARLVEELPIPGLDGSSLLNQPAPDFELEPAHGAKSRLSDLRGHAVLLAFSAGGLADVAAIETKYKDKGLVVLSIGADSKAARLYRVLLAPTIVVIDAEGRVVRFLPGARNVAALEAALKSAGL